MHKYALTFRFNSSNPSRYQQIYSDFIAYVQSIGGKEDNTTSTVVFYTNTSPDVIRENIRNYYNQNRDLINTGDRITLFSTELDTSGNASNYISELKFWPTASNNQHIAFWKFRTYDEYCRQQD